MNVCPTAYIFTFTLLQEEGKTKLLVLYFSTLQPKSYLIPNAYTQFDWKEEKSEIRKEIEHRIITSFLLFCWAFKLPKKKSRSWFQ